MPDELGESPAAYIRQSTDQQSNEHQIDDIKTWLNRRDVQIGDVEFYVDDASGAKRDRDDFIQLIDDIRAGDISDVVVWEISRIARNGAIAEEFFDLCEDESVTIYVTNGAVRRVEPNGHGRLVASIVASVAAEERRRLIERTRSGIRRAKNEGKWVGQVPAGFTTVEGYLRPNWHPDYDAGETGFEDIVDALLKIESGVSYRSAAKETPNVTRQTLMRIHKDDGRQSWYLDAEADDDRIHSALEDVESVDLPETGADLDREAIEDMIDDRVRQALDAE